MDKSDVRENPTSVGGTNVTESLTVDTTHRLSEGKNTLKKVKFHSPVLQAKFGDNEDVEKPIEQEKVTEVLQQTPPVEKSLVLNRDDTNYFSVDKEIARQKGAIEGHGKRTGGVM